MSLLTASMAALSALTAGCASSTEASSYQLTRSAQGIAQITALDHEGLAAGLGFAYAQDNFCLLQETLLTVNGQRSLHLGPEAQVGVETNHRSISNLESDFFYRFYIDSAFADALYANSDAKSLALIRGYVAGVNQYLRDTPADKLDASCRGKPWLRPITTTDVHKILVDKAILASGVNFIQAFEAASPPKAGVAAIAPAASTASLNASALQSLSIPTPPLASNGWAFGRDRTEGGGSLLFGNPHFPWESSNRFYQLRLTIPGELDVAGAALGGFPFVQIGYNAQFAWSHTTATGKRFTLYELALKPGSPTTYVVDGVERAMTAVDISVPVATSTGTETRTKRFYTTEFGPLLSLPNAGLNWTAQRAYAFADVNRDNNRMLRGWMRLASAKSVREAREALGAELGIPWVNTIAADSTGEVMYADITPIPNVGTDDITRCAPSTSAAALLKAAGLVVLDGSKASCRWTVDPSTPAPGLTPPARLASVIRTDFVANSNDSYWLANPAHRWPAMSPMLGAVDVQQRPRTRAALGIIERRFNGADGLPGNTMNADRLKTLWFDSRNDAARWVLDDLLAECEKSNETVLADGTRVSLVAGCAALRQWDRRSAIHSRGAHLFREFWKLATAIPGVYAVPFDAADPVATPRGLKMADPVVRGKVLMALGSAIRLFEKAGVALDAELGSVQYALVGGLRIPFAGGDEVEGVMNKQEFLGFSGGRYTPFYGSSYVQLIGFEAAGQTAEGLLVYSQSTDSGSAYFGDQLPAYSSGKMLLLPVLK